MSRTLYYGIVNRHNVLQDFTSQWHLHTQRSIETLGNVTNGKNYEVIEDYYRANRYDIVTSYIRSFDASQKVPITNPSDINNPIGKRLVVLLDRYISIVIALVTRSVRKKVSPEDWSALLLRLRLVSDPMFVTRYDPLTDALENGRQIVGLLANVYKWRSSFFKSSQVPLDIATYNQNHVDAFNRYLESDPSIRVAIPSVVASLQATNVPVTGGAVDLWNHHLASLLLTLKGTAPSVLGSIMIANLFAASVLIRASSGQVHAFPSWRSIGIPS